MLRWMVAWFKKILPPIITTYSRRAGWDDMRNSIRQQLDNMGIDAWMLEWAQKISTQWWVEILHEYLVWWEWFDMNTWDDGFVVVLANANKDILWITYKSREELWTETYYNLRNAFEMAETDMTDAIWSMCISWFSLTLTVSTSAGVITISDSSQSLSINSTSHNMKVNFVYDYYNEVLSNNCITEYSTLSDKWWLIDWTYTYPAASQDVNTWNNIVASLKTKWNSWYSVYHDTTNQEIQIKNWTRVVFTMRDRNLWASSCDITSSDSYWDMYHRWALTPSWSAQETNREETKWINVQWMPSWFHIPTINEFQDFCSLIGEVWWIPTTWRTTFTTTFLMPEFERTSSLLSWGARLSTIEPNQWNPSFRAVQYWHEDDWSYSFIEFPYPWYNSNATTPIRPFKNTYTLIPINQLRSTFWDTTDVQNEMNSHPYDYYLLWWCTTPLTLASWAWAMRRVYASYDTNTNTWSVMEVS